MAAAEMMRAAQLAAMFTREGMMERASGAEDAAAADACRAAASEILTAGMPLAALPVESLYKPWSALSSELAGARGLYMGDAAHHLLQVYSECGIEVPSEFTAMPDHLALTSELAALLAQAGNMEGAAQIAADHLDWLGDYDAVLAQRAAQAAAMGPDAGPLAAGIAMLRELLAEIADLVESSIR